VGEGELQGGMMKVYRVTLLLDQAALDFVSEASGYSEWDEVFVFEKVDGPFDYKEDE
jgi:hypothetical protein